MDVTGPRYLDKYELLARLAKGGMAEILLARQQGVGFSRLVVIKRILPHLAEEPEFVEMFRDEAQHAALINHPNVVQIYDVGESGGVPYIAMELIRGLTVGEINRAARRRGELLPVEVAVEIVIQTCEGLHAAHELRDDTGEHVGLVHRDVSPHNLMVTEAGVVKLVDFGIAKAQSSAMRTESGLVRGKGPYLSPEQCKGQPIDRRTDIFSLGSTFYELVVGPPLFERETAFLTLKAISEDRVPRPSTLRRDVPEQIDAAIMRCLERDPGRRFPGAAALAAELRGVQERSGPPAPHLLADHLEAEHREELAAREAAIRAAVESPPGPDRPLPGLDDSERPTGTLEQRQLSTAAVTPRRRWILVLALVIIVLAGGAGYLLRERYSAPARPPGPPVTLGVAPVFTLDEARREARPLLDYLERRVGRRFELRVPRDYESLRSGLARGKLDLAVLNHLQYLLTRREEPRVEALAIQAYEGSVSYRSEIIVRDNAGIHSVADLVGRKFCYVTPGSASGFIVPRYFLRQQGLDPDRDLPQAHYSGDHAQVLRDVIRGRCDAGAVSSGAFFRAPRHGIATSRVRVLATAGRIPMDLICASPGLGAGLRQAIRRALLRFKPQRDIKRRYLGIRYPVEAFRQETPDFSLFERAARAEGILP